MVDVVIEHVGRPVMFQGCPGVGQLLIRVLQAREEHHVVAPGQLPNGLLGKIVNNLLTIFSTGPRLGKKAHVLEVCR